MIRCPEGSQLNELTQQCESCPPNFTYNATISRCQAAVSITCPSAYNYNPSTKLCDLKPITLPTPITPITPPTLAVICTNGFSYNQASQRCEQVSITNPNTENLITNNMSLYQNNYNQKRLENPNIKDCASSSPFYDSTLGSCVSCPEQYPFFNLVTNKCQDCGDGKYDSTTYKCQPKGLNYDPTLSRFVMNVLWLIIYYDIFTSQHSIYYISSTLKTSNHQQNQKSRRFQHHTWYLVSSDSINIILLAIHREYLVTICFTWWLRSSILCWFCVLRSKESIPGQIQHQVDSTSHNPSKDSISYALKRWQTGPGKPLSAWSYWYLFVRYWEYG